MKTTWQEIEEKAFAQQRLPSPISDALCAVAAQRLARLREDFIAEVTE